MEIEWQGQQALQVQDNHLVLAGRVRVATKKQMLKRRRRRKKYRMKMPRLKCLNLSRFPRNSSDEATVTVSSSAFSSSSSVPSLSSAAMFIPSKSATSSSLPLLPAELSPESSYRSTSSGSPSAPATSSSALVPLSSFPSTYTSATSFSSSTSSALSKPSTILTPAFLASLSTTYSATPPASSAPVLFDVPLPPIATLSFTNFIEFLYFSPLARAHTSLDLIIRKMGICLQSWYAETIGMDLISGEDAEGENEENNILRIRDGAEIGAEENELTITSNKKKQLKKKAKAKLKKLREKEAKEKEEQETKEKLRIEEEERQEMLKKKRIEDQTIAATAVAAVQNSSSGQSAEIGSGGKGKSFDTPSKKGSIGSPTGNTNAVTTGTSAGSVSTPSKTLSSPTVTPIKAASTAGDLNEQEWTEVKRRGDKPSLTTPTTLSRRAKDDFFTSHPNPNSSILSSTSSSSSCLVLPKSSSSSFLPPHFPIRSSFSPSFSNTTSHFSSSLRAQDDTYTNRSAYRHASGTTYPSSGSFSRNRSSTTTTISEGKGASSSGHSVGGAQTMPTTPGAGGTMTTPSYAQTMSGRGERKPEKGESQSAGASVHHSPHASIHSATVFQRHSSSSSQPTPSSHPAAPSSATPSPSVSSVSGSSTRSSDELQLLMDLDRHEERSRSEPNIITPNTVESTIGNHVAVTMNRSHSGGASATMMAVAGISQPTRGTGAAVAATTTGPASTTANTTPSVSPLPSVVGSISPPSSISSLSSTVPIPAVPISSSVATASVSAPGSAGSTTRSIATTAATTVPQVPIVTQSAITNVENVGAPGAGAMMKPRVYGTDDVSLSAWQVKQQQRQQTKQQQHQFNLAFYCVAIAVSQQAVRLEHKSQQQFITSTNGIRAYSNQSFSVPISPSSAASSFVQYESPCQWEQYQQRQR